MTSGSTEHGVDRCGGGLEWPHPTHRSMAAKIGLDAVLPLAEQRDTLAAVGCQGLNFNHPSR